MARVAPTEPTAAWTPGRDLRRHLRARLGEGAPHEHVHVLHRQQHLAAGAEKAAAWAARAVVRRVARKARRGDDALGGPAHEGAEGREVGGLAQDRVRDAVGHEGRDSRVFQAARQPVREGLAVEEAALQVEKGDPRGEGQDAQEAAGLNGDDARAARKSWLAVPRISRGAARRAVAITCSAKRARSAFLSNLPTLVLGTASMNTMSSGSAHLRHVGPQVVEELLLGGGPAGPQDHAGERPLGPLRMRDRDHAGLLHRGMGHEPVLEVDARDPLSPALDEVLAAVGDLQEALGVDGDHVAGLEPAVLEAGGASARRCSSWPPPRARAPAARPGSRRPRAPPGPPRSSPAPRPPPPGVPCLARMRKRSASGSACWWLLRRLMVPRGEVSVMPQAWITSRPCFFWKASMAAWGMAAPPTIIARRLVRS